jgi:hypothetical protein
MRRILLGSRSGHPRMNGKESLDSGHSGDMRFQTLPAQCTYHTEEGTRCSGFCQWPSTLIRSYANILRPCEQETGIFPPLRSLSRPWLRSLRMSALPLSCSRADMRRSGNIPFLCLPGRPHSRQRENTLAYLRIGGLNIRILG